MIFNYICVALKITLSKIFVKILLQKNGRSERPQNRTDAITSGRSIVEMLGVLAIIGVLSVGAMSGYSKAMFKYKLNRQRESFSLILNYALQYSAQLKTEGQQTFFNNFFYKMNLIPDGMTYNTTTQKIYDNFNNIVTIYRNIEQDGTTEVNVLSVSMDTSDISKEICLNLIIAAQENAHSLHSVSADRHPYRLYGDAYCTAGRKCLRRMTLYDTPEICESCTEEFQQQGSCRLMIMWY